MNNPYSAVSLGGLYDDRFPPVLRNTADVFFLSEIKKKITSRSSLKKTNGPQTVSRSSIMKPVAQKLIGELPEYDVLSLSARENGSH